MPLGCRIRSLASLAKSSSIPLCVLTVFLMLIVAMQSANAGVEALSLQSPNLLQTGTTDLVSPIHIQATAEDTSSVTGYVVYLDNQNVYQNFRPSIDAWIVLPPGKHSLYVKAWDSESNLSTSRYSINVTGFAPPAPPINANRILGIDNGVFTVDNNPNVGGNCNHGSIGSFPKNVDPNTRNLPTADGLGQHFMVTSGCQYDDSLFYQKFSKNPAKFLGDTNFLWDFWFYIPTSVGSSTVEAIEFDLFETVPFPDGVHEFMFGTQCNYSTNQWQLWLPQGTNLAWVNAGISPCRFAPGTWHHAIYFLQRVTPLGYQKIPSVSSQSTDPNTSLRFGTLTLDGQTAYLGGVAWSTIPSPAWTSVLGVQHQLDSAAAGVVLEEYVDGESVVFW